MNIAHRLFVGLILPLLDNCGLAGGLNWTRLNQTFPNGMKTDFILRQVFLGQGTNAPIVISGPACSASLNDDVRYRGHPLMWRSIDGGATWLEFVNTTYPSNAYDNHTPCVRAGAKLLCTGRWQVWAATSSNAWALNNATDVKMQMGSNRYDTSATGDSDSPVPALACYDANRCAVVRGTASPCPAYFTTNGGVNWTVATTPSRCPSVTGSNAAAMPAPDTYIAARNASHALRTSDLGTTWSYIPFPWPERTGSPSRFYMLNSTHMLVVASRLYIVTSIDGWASLTLVASLPPPVSATITSVHFINTVSILALGTLPSSPQRLLWQYNGIALSPPPSLPPPLADPVSILSHPDCHRRSMFIRRERVAACRVKRLTRHMESHACMHASPYSPSHACMLYVCLAAPSSSRPHGPQSARRAESAQPALPTPGTASPTPQPACATAAPSRSV